MFRPKSVHVIFMVDKVPLVQVFLAVLLSSPVGIVPPLNHTHLHLRVAFTRKINARNLGTLSKASGCCHNCWRSVRAFRVLRHVHLELRCEFREINVIRNCDNE